jgi:hypothetical protein
MAYDNDKTNTDGYKIHSKLLRYIDDIFLLEETIETNIFWFIKLPFITVYNGCQK